MTAESSTRVTIPVDDVVLPGNLVVPEEATGLVVFAHGSGSSRHSPRNNFVADRLQSVGLGTLLFDLLTEQEDQRRESRFDVERLTDRLAGTTDWVRSQSETADLNVGYFGSSTGAAGALRAAARRGDVDAVVSRGGRVDMASDVFDRVTTPTLLVVGGEDHQVRQYNEQATQSLAGPSELFVVEGAGHLFEGPGELETVADRAADWFVSHLA